MAKHIDRIVSYHLSLSFNLGGWKLLLVIKKRALWKKRHRSKFKTSYNLLHITYYEVEKVVIFLHLSRYICLSHIRKQGKNRCNN